MRATLMYGEVTSGRKTLASASVLVHSVRIGANNASYALGRNHSNSRNGVRLAVMTEIGPADIEVPRDVEATFAPRIVRKRERRLTGVDQIVLSLSVAGRPPEKISAHFAEVYGASVSRQTVSTNPTR